MVTMAVRAGLRLGLARLLSEDVMFVFSFFNDFSSMIVGSLVSVDHSVSCPT